MPDWPLSAVSVVAPALIIVEPGAAASPIGVQLATTLAEGNGIGLELLVQLIGMLLLVLGLFAACAWSVKRWKLLPQMRGGQNRLQILESKSLGQRNSIMVVGYGDQRFLIGTNSAGLQLLGELPDEKNNLGQADQVADEATSKGGDVKKGGGESILSEMNRHIGKESA